jgi:hypothetical protein
MPENKVNDPITDQEIAFARLVLSGGMTDRRAAEAVGLNPDSAAHTKSKPHVRAYMLQHRAAVQQQLVQQEADGLHRLNLDREQVLGRLWEIANLSPEMTRGSITGQVKALSMIVAMQNFIPDRLAVDRLPVSSEKKSPPAPDQEDQQEDSPVPGGVPACPGVPWKPDFAPGSAGEAPPRPGPGQSTFANRFTPSEAPAPYVPLFASVPDLRVPFSIKNPFVHPAELPIPKKDLKISNFTNACQLSRHRSRSPEQ